VEYSAPQIADRAEPFRSKIRAILGGRTEELEALAVEMYARGLSTRDIEAVFADETGKSLLSRSAVSAVTERLWAEYEAFAGRDLAEFDLVYLFVDGIPEQLHLGQPREAVLAAWASWRTARKRCCIWRRHQGGHGELPRVLSGPAPARTARPVAGRQRWRTGRDPRHRGVFPALAAPALSGAQDAQSAKAGCRRTCGRSSRRVPRPAIKPPRRRWRACCAMIS
jgi:Transposase, Mutator family